MLLEVVLLLVLLLSWLLVPKLLSSTNTSTSSTGPPVSDVYTTPDTGLVYTYRYLWWVASLWQEQRQRRKRMDNYNLYSVEYEYCGMIPTPEEQGIEAPKALTTDRHEDGVTLWGVDGSGRTVWARVVRLAGHRASVALTVTDDSGAVYTMPHQPASTVHYTCEAEWRGAGLLLQCCQPMRTWRLKFNGYLRRGARTHYHAAPCPEDEEGVVLCSLDLVWRALRGPVDLFRDSSPRLLAHALAREHHADLLYYTSLDRDAYDQAGVLAGEVDLGTGDLPQQWRLRGGRQRRWGMSEAATGLHRSVELLTLMDDGNILYQYTFCFPASLTHCTFGYIVTVAGDYKPFTDTDFCMGRVGETTLPEGFKFNATAGGLGLSVSASLSLQQSVTFHTGDPWTLRHSVVPGTARVGGAAARAIAVFTWRFNELCPVPEELTLTIDADNEHASEDWADNPLVASISDPLCRNPQLAGGKGASLAVMANLLQDESPERFTVPRGVVVTVEAWARQVESAPALSAALSHLQRACGAGQDATVREACNKAASVVRSTPVCPQVREAVTEALQELYEQTQPNVSRFAVRSSGCDEDGSEASAAGQNLTVLGCVGLRQALDALPQCWASGLEYASVHYRRQRGLAAVSGMAVVVQEMAVAEVAGVIFTRHPTTGSPHTITVTANYGLGESVVSGSAEPDTIEVRRSWRDQLTVARTTVGQKLTRHVLAAVAANGSGEDSPGTVTEVVPVTARHKCCLDENLALRLAALALHLERVFASPRDIEFAVSQNVVYLLQARPITGLDCWSEEELLLELDTAILKDDDLLTRANTGEVLPQPLTPLTNSIVSKTLDLIMQQNLFEMGTSQRYRIDPANTRTLATSHLHVFINMMELNLRSVEAELGLVHHAQDMSICGRRVVTQEHIDRAGRRNGIMSKIKGLMALPKIISIMMWNNRRVRAAATKFRRYDIRDSLATDAAALYADICRRLPHLIEMGKNHILASTASSVSQMFVFQALAQGNTELSAANITDMATLLSNSSEETGQDSTGVPDALAELARIIVLDDEVSEFLAMPPDEAVVWLSSHPRTVGDIYQLFLDNHGHRCINEFELQCLSWGMDYGSLVHCLRTLVSSKLPLASSCSSAPGSGAGGSPNTPGGSPKTPAPPSLNEVLDKLNTPLQAGTKRALRLLVPLTRSSVQRRETTKSCLIKVLDAFKKTYRSLGALLVMEGRLPDADLVFALQHHEIGTLLDAPSPALLAKAVRRMRLVEKMSKLQFPEMSDGPPRPLSDAPLSPPLPCEGDLVMTGTPVCLGQATGTARIVTQLHDAIHIQKGDILVTYSTDVGWTPYFPLLAGVVTEIGGLISHGAVVAREYGLPCVVGAANATRTFRSGDTLYLDGSKGTVTRPKST